MEDKLWLLAGASKREGEEIIPFKVHMEVLGPREKLELPSIQKRYKEKVMEKILSVWHHGPEFGAFLSLASCLSNQSSVPEICGQKEKLHFLFLFFKEKTSNPENRRGLWAEEAALIPFFMRCIDIYSMLMQHCLLYQASISIPWTFLACALFTMRSPGEVGLQGFLYTLASFYANLHAYAFSPYTPGAISDSQTPVFNSKFQCSLTGMSKW